MAIEFRPVTLDSGEPDHEAMLMFRDGRLAAVLTCLGDIHGEMQGHWFVEAMFPEREMPVSATFQTLAAAEAWAGAF